MTPPKNPGKTLEDYQRIISKGYTLSITELRHMNKLWEAAIEKLRNAK